jgi:hypothetical protein
MAQSTSKSWTIDTEEGKFMTKISIPKRKYDELIELGGAIGNICVFCFYTDKEQIQEFMGNLPRYDLQRTLTVYYAVDKEEWQHNLQKSIGDDISKIENANTRRISQCLLDAIRITDYATPADRTGLQHILTGLAPLQRVMLFGHGYNHRICGPPDVGIQVHPTLISIKSIVQWLTRDIPDAFFDVIFSICYAGLINNPEYAIEVPPNLALTFAESPKCGDMTTSMRSINEILTGVLGGKRNRKSLRKLQRNRKSQRKRNRNHIKLR